LAQTGRAIDKLVPTIGLDTSSVQMVAITVRYFDGDDKLIARHPGFPDSTMPLTRDLNQYEAVTESGVISMPCVDFQHLPTDPDKIAKVRNACAQAGFFVLENAFESDSSIHRTIEQMHRFFSLPDNDAVKQAVAIHNIDGKHGWTPMFGEPAYQPGTIAHMESFGCGPDGASAWPNLIDFESDIRGCWETLSNIGDTVLESLALASGIEQDFFCDQCATRELSTMRLLHYPQNSAPNLEQNVGIAAHTDFECMSLILQTAPGLELRTRSGEWIDAPAERGQIVVLLGDMLERWTNGKFQATGHRVRNTETQRMSIVMFLAVNDGVEVKPLPNFVNDDAPAQYEATDQRRHLAAEIAQAEIYRDDTQ
tara:strand:+ start:532 stop:1632 length:1101 start_codon:yes stop_codon:yes gene_type:complete